MKKYKLEWVDEVSNGIIVEAESEEALRNKFNNGELDLSDCETTDERYIEDSMEITELEK